MRYKKAAFAFSMLYAVCLLGIAGYWNKTKPVDAAVEVSEKPKIAITFDDGPSVYTEELLDGLKDRGVKATFFVIGKSAVSYPDIVKRESNEGHLVGNHTYNHVEITKIGANFARPV